ncbi:MAG: radical SAM protein [Lachnospiraceae bacterium]|nr:radical SAM protein [Lachnospiraceae bacterium]
MAIRHKVNEHNSINVCSLCPRNCNIDRSLHTGVCGSSNIIRIARADLHFYEEPCISGKNGSGAVFFSGCALHCVFCQNEEISCGVKGMDISPERLTEIFFELKEKGAHNINLVTGDHYIPEIADTLIRARSKGLDIPIIFNCSGYEKAETLRILDGLIDVYLPDMKYSESDLAKKYSNAEDYPDVVKDAISEMVRQQPQIEFDSEGMIKKGVIVRNLLLPGHVMNSKKVLRYLHETYGNQIYLSIMSQYTPMKAFPDSLQNLNRRVKKSEYERLLGYAIKMGIENAYIQEMNSSGKDFIPDFNLENP